MFANAKETEVLYNSLEREDGGYIDPEGNMYSYREVCDMLVIIWRSAKMRLEKLEQLNKENQSE